MSKRSNTSIESSSKSRKIEKDEYADLPDFVDFSTSTDYLHFDNYKRCLEAFNKHAMVKHGMMALFDQTIKYIETWFKGSREDPLDVKRKQISNPSYREPERESLLRNPMIITRLGTGIANCYAHIIINSVEFGPFFHFEEKPNIVNILKEQHAKGWRVVLIPYSRDLFYSQYIDWDEQWSYITRQDNPYFLTLHKETNLETMEQVASTLDTNTNLLAGNGIHPIGQGKNHYDDELYRVGFINRIKPFKCQGVGCNNIVKVCKEPSPGWYLDRFNDSYYGEVHTGIYTKGNAGRYGHKFVRICYYCYEMRESLNKNKVDRID